MNLITIPVKWTEPVQYIDSEKIQYESGTISCSNPMPFIIIENYDHPDQVFIIYEGRKYIVEMTLNELEDHINDEIKRMSR